MRNLSLKGMCLIFILLCIQNALIAQDTTKLPPVKEVLDQIDMYLKGQDTSKLPPFNELINKLRMYKITPDTIPLPPKKELVNKTEMYPNPSGKGMMTPSGWGGRLPFVFGFIGATFPQVYTSKPDMIAAAGVGLGDSYKTVSVVGIFNILNVSSASTYSGSLIVSRHIGKGTSMSVGGLNLLASKRSDAGASFYIALSHASQKIKPKTKGYAALSYTIGAGSGRFYEKSPKDIQTGKGKHGTAVFANVSYELIKGLNIIGEWSGLNLGFAFSWRPSFGKSMPFKLPAINIGLTDITRLTGEKPRFIMSLGHTILLKKK